MTSFSPLADTIIPIISRGSIGLPFIISATVYIFATLFKFVKRPRDNGGNSIPNGPIGFPLIGTFYSLVTQVLTTKSCRKTTGSFPSLIRYPELALDHWAKKFGPLYSMWLGNQLFVVVSDSHIAKELLSSNGNIFSSRKEMFIKSKTIFRGRGITVMPNDARWSGLLSHTSCIWLLICKLRKNHRKIINGFLNSSALEDHGPALKREAKALIQELYKYGKGGMDTVNPQPHAGRYSLNVMLTIVFGTRTDTLEHPLVGRVLKLSREFM